MRLGQTAEGIAAYRKAISLAPDISLLHEKLGLALVQTGKHEEAEASLRKSISLSPKTAPRSCLALAQVHLQRGERKQAAALLRMASECESDAIARKFYLARAFFHESDMEGAEALLRELISLRQDFFEAYRLLGQMLQQHGRFEEAEAIFRKAIELRPTWGLPYELITRGRKMGGRDAQLIEQMRSALIHVEATPADSCSLHYALGKCFNDIGDYEVALREFDQANEIARRLMLQGKPFDRAGLEIVYEHAAAVFNPEFFTRNRPLGSDSDKPIFIVGMLRSGTTLVEQIISSHPDVGAAGELPFWTRTGLELLDVTGRVVDEMRLREAQSAYLRILEEAAPGKARVTDKRPGNCNVLGQIHVAFPRAKIIHCQRDPVDTALSIYMTPNAAPIEFAYVRENIVLAFKEYRRLLRHYQDVLPPGSILGVQYEELATEPDRVIRRMIEFLGLEWSESCLRHEENTRAVATPTLWQARQPIYTSSIRRWKKYEPWLGAFRELIEDAR
jgi:tetratricopeptide (TPR) repeat protein